MKQIMELSDYVKLRREEIGRLGKELYFLERICLPLDVHVFGDAFSLYSKDYSLATKFKIESRRKDGRMSGSAGPDGSYCTTIIEFYPQFYFRVPDQSKNRQVMVQHKGFEDDTRVVLKKFTQTEGWGCYADESGTEENYADTTKALSFFEKNGVSKELIDKLSKKAEKITGKRYDWI